MTFRNMKCKSEDYLNGPESINLYLYLYIEKLPKIGNLNFVKF